MCYTAQPHPTRPCVPSMRRPITLVSRGAALEVPASSFRVRPVLLAHCLLSPLPLSHVVQAVRCTHVLVVISGSMAHLKNTHRRPLTRPSRRSGFY